MTQPTCGYGYFVFTSPWHLPSLNTNLESTSSSISPYHLFYQLVSPTMCLLQAVYSDLLVLRSCYKRLAGTSGSLTAPLGHCISWMRDAYSLLSWVSLWQAFGIWKHSLIGLRVRLMALTSYCNTLTDLHSYAIRIPLLAELLRPFKFFTTTSLQGHLASCCLWLNLGSLELVLSLLIDSSHSPSQIYSLMLNSEILLGHTSLILLYTRKSVSIARKLYIQLPNLHKFKNFCHQM